MRLLTLLLIFLAIVSCTSRRQPTPLQPAEAIVDTVPAPPETLTLLFAGDMMQHQPQFAAALRRNSGYDYSGCFDAVRQQIEEADIAIANLETTLAGPPYSGYPCFCAPDAFAEAIQQAGFDLLLTANNHSCDKRKKGICRTIEVLDSLHLPHLGTYADSTERQQQYPYILEAKGYRIALLCYTYSTNGLPVPEPTVVNLIDTAQMEIDIRKARTMHPDAIIAFMHWGVEYTLKQTSHQIKMAEWLLSHGVTHIIGGHPHVVEPIELRTDSITGQRHLICYSLGNYVSHQTPIDRTGGLMVRLTLGRDSAGHCRVDSADYSFSWVSRPNISHQRLHRILPANYPDSLLNASERQQRDAFLRNARQLFKQYNLGIDERIDTSLESNDA